MSLIETKIQTCPDYLRSSMDLVADKRTRQVLPQRIHHEFSDGSSGIGFLKSF